LASFAGGPLRRGQMSPRQVGRDHEADRVVALVLDIARRHIRFDAGDLSMHAVEDLALVKHDGRS
jgi:hypothetical protein